MKIVITLEDKYVTSVEMYEGSKLKSKRLRPANLQELQKLVSKSWYFTESLRDFMLDTKREESK